MGEIKTVDLNVMLNGVWVKIGDAEVLLRENNTIEKVISFTPGNFSDPNILKVPSERVAPEDVPRFDEKL